MTRNNTQTCRCCLRVIRNTESRLQTTAKISEIFDSFMGFALPPGVICGQCNLNLLTFDAFQKEVRRKHSEAAASVPHVKLEPIASSSPPPPPPEIFAVPVGPDGEDQEMFEAVLMDERGMVEAMPEEEGDGGHKSPTPSPQKEEEEAGSEADEDVIVLPQVPQVPIDLDEISDEPQPRPKAPEEVIFKCDHCTAVSAKKEVIVRHIKQSHTFKCDTCAKVFPSEERLKAHDLRTHRAVVGGGSGNRRKQSMTAVRTTEENMKFRLKSKPYGRPWPSRFAKGEYDE